MRPGRHKTKKGAEEIYGFRTFMEVSANKCGSQKKSVCKRVVIVYDYCSTQILNNCTNTQTCQTILNEALLVLRTDDES